MLAKLGLILAGSTCRKGISSTQPTLACLLCAFRYVFLL